MPMEKQGKCLCGASRFTVEIDAMSVNACHCGMCRRWGGGPLLAVHCSSALSWQGDRPSVYESSDWAERGFCSRCGTHLFYRLKADGSCAVPVGVLDDDSGWQLDLQIFIEEKPAYYCFGNQTRMLTGEEAFQALG